jgi:purine-binding chemotaxis protein CheW
LPLDQPTDGGPSGVEDYLTFQIAGSLYAVPAACVVEVAPSLRPAPLPGAPAIVLGVINVHGRHVAVFDVRGRFGAGAAELGLDEHLIVVRADGRLVALAVDRATGLASIAAAEIAGRDALGVEARHVAGVAGGAEGAVVIHDIDRFLDEQEARRLDDALAVLDGGEAAP